MKPATVLTKPEGERILRHAQALHDLVGVLVNNDRPRRRRKRKPRTRATAKHDKAKAPPKPKANKAKKYPVESTPNE